MCDVMEMDADPLNTCPASSLPGAQPTMIGKPNRPRYEGFDYMGMCLIKWDESLPDK